MKTPASAVLAVLLCLSAPALAQVAPDEPEKPKMPAIPGEKPVDLYTITNDNAGAKPSNDPALLKAFHGKEGIGRIVDDLADHVKADTRTEEVFHAADMVRLRRTLKEQLCYLLGGGCSYTGRSMKDAHKDQGVSLAEFNALVELLEDAMDRERVPFAAQNRLLAKLAAMEPATVRR
jgi:hemoglobin